MEENDKSSTQAGRIFQRTVAIVDNPTLFPGSRLDPGLREDLQQLMYKVQVRLESMEHKEYLLAATSPYINDCLGAKLSALESRLKKEKLQKNTLICALHDDLANHRVLAACCGDFHTLVLSQGATKFGSDANVEDNYLNWADVYGFGQNIHGQVLGLSNPIKHVATPTIVPFFIGKHIKLIAAKGSRSVAIGASGDIYEWGFPEIVAHKSGYLEVLLSQST